MWELLMGCGKHIQYIPTYIHIHGVLHMVTDSW